MRSICAKNESTGAIFDQSSKQQRNVLVIGSGQAGGYVWSRADSNVVIKSYLLQASVISHRRIKMSNDQSIGTQPGQVNKGGLGGSKLLSDFYLKARVVCGQNALAAVTLTETHRYSNILWLEGNKEQEETAFK